jgi:hypothetical protein
LETSAHWPQDRETAIVSDLAAALADLRFLQGFLASPSDSQSENSGWMRSPSMKRRAATASRHNRRVSA